MPPALGTLSLSHWTTREVPVSVLMRDIVAVCANFYLKHFLKWYAQFNTFQSVSQTQAIEFELFNKND